MAEPGDPHAPEDHDDLIGFASPASLLGRPRTVLSEPPPAEPEPDLFAAPVRAPAAPEPAMIRIDPAPEPVLAQPERPAAPAASIFEPSPEFQARQRRRDDPAIPGGGMGLYAVYALILFAVPTLGVSAVIGLFAVTGRSGPDDPVAQAHFVYQQRTLWIAAMAVVVGLIFFLVPFGLGPVIMFVAALWLVARGAAGVWALKAGRPVARPRGLWI